MHTPPHPNIISYKFTPNPGFYTALGPFLSPHYVRPEATGTPTSVRPFERVCEDLEEDEHGRREPCNLPTWTTQAPQLRNELPNIISSWVGLGECQSSALFVLHDVHTFSLWLYGLNILKYG